MGLKRACAGAEERVRRFLMLIPILFTVTCAIGLALIAGTMYANHMDWF